MNQPNQYNPIQENSNYQTHVDGVGHVYVDYALTDGEWQITNAQIYDEKSQEWTSEITHDLGGGDYVQISIDNQGNLTQTHYDEQSIGSQWSYNFTETNWEEVQPSAPDPEPTQSTPRRSRASNLSQGSSSISPSSGKPKSQFAQALERLKKAGHTEHRFNKKVNFEFDYTRKSNLRSVTESKVTKSYEEFKKQTEEQDANLDTELKNMGPHSRM